MKLLRDRGRREPARASGQWIAWQAAFFQAFLNVHSHGILLVGHHDIPPSVSIIPARWTHSRPWLSQMPRRHNHGGERVQLAGHSGNALSPGPERLFGMSRAAR